ncbi:non-hydrolyzing UDP-N-acetylglucosamine 2-epimerase [Sneathiella limimaris]|uniref:non-hydrolyzing UDP-N-acetylglucosamine 2-epimerase n=1 Tax=Sneathiella limimaris TaxID=1964213 RepID=UPI00146F0350|nr:UDP-N-acetylglucosamine 2-epimerase (non-hydrolyzing) [Sneathiella limimaris]
MQIQLNKLSEKPLSPEVGLVVGTRPSIVMFAPLIHKMRERKIPHFVIHTGQHFSPSMDSAFFQDLELPQPDYKLEGVSENKTHGSQTAAMLQGVEKILLQRLPCFFLVGGDANTNLAAALAARKLHINIGHIEAGERSFDKRMPEEHNRIMIDHISDFLFATNENSIKNLKNEGLTSHVFLTGNPIVDATLRHYELTKKNAEILRELNLEPNRYLLLTTHREENVDTVANLRGSLQGVQDFAAQKSLPVIFPAHPRTLKRIDEFGLNDWLKDLDHIKVIEPQGYLNFLELLASAKLVFTDSGGVQQEAAIHKVPAVTLRDNTEWIETLDLGANQLAGCNPERILASGNEMISKERNWPTPFGDGSTSDQIADIANEVIGHYSAS